MSTDQAQKELARIAGQLAPLRNLESFQFLLRELEKKAERMRRDLTWRMMAGEDMTRVQRAIDYDRGFIDGMSYVNSVVVGAENTLERLEQVEEPEVEIDRWALEQPTQ